MEEKANSKMDMYSLTSFFIRHLIDKVSCSNGRKVFHQVVFIHFFPVRFPLWPGNATIFTCFEMQTEPSTISNG